MKSITSIFTRFAGLPGVFVLLTAIFISGCKSLDNPSSAAFASVVIYNQTPDKIRQATDAVFANNNYQAIRNPDGSQVYEREATKGEQMAYAGFVGAHEGVRTIVRVRMGIEPQGVNAYRLSCKAFVVTSPGDFVSEQTFPLYGWQSGPYQDLLNNVRDNLKVAAMQATQTP